jgi:hypothetical protein
MYNNRINTQTTENSVSNLINSQHESEIMRNRLYLQKIIENIIFVARQGIALGAHREGESSINKGLMINLLFFIFFLIFSNYLLKKEIF